MIGSCQRLFRSTVEGRPAGVERSWKFA